MQTIEAILLGLTLGAGTLLFIGPVLFYLVKSSVDHGQRAGNQVALGIITGDIIYVFIVANGLSDYLSSNTAQQYMAIIGGAILLLFGIKPFISSKNQNLEKDTVQSKSSLTFFINGFVINFVNPFVITVWIGFYVLCDARLESSNQINIALISCLVFIFSTDLLKARLSLHLKKFLTSERMQILSKSFGVLMLLFGLRLLYVGLIV